MSKAFASLSDPLRRRIIEIVLRDPGMTVNDLCEHFEVSRFTVMRHLNNLEAAELLVRERQGTLKRLYIDRDNLADVSKGWLRKVIRDQ